MSSLREQALAALYDRLKAGLAAQVRRADGTGAPVPKTGVIVTQDDGALEAEPIMSPLCWDITHTVSITIEAGKGSRAAVDDALLGIAAVLAADPTLGGKVEWAGIDGMDADSEAPSDGAQILPRLLTAQLTVTMTYTAPTPVG